MEVPNEWHEHLPNAQPIAAEPGKVEVVEFFWYGCPRCYTLEPHLVLWNRYSRQSYVNFLRVPATWRTERRAHARLYYVLQALGREDLHAHVFDAIHRRAITLYTANDAAQTFRQQLAFAMEYGIGEAEFTRAYNSPIVDANLRRAEQLARHYLIKHVPTIVINGKYATDIGRTSGNEDALIERVQELAEREHRRSQP